MGLHYTKERGLINLFTKYSLASQIDRYLLFRDYFLRPDPKEFIEVCAICNANFIDETQLEDHVNEIHRKGTNPKSRNSAPPDRLKDEMAKGSHYLFSTWYQIYVQQNTGCPINIKRFCLFHEIVDYF